MKINSKADGMAVARPNGFEIDFVRNPISESAALFFVIILKFIYKPIFEIKIYQKMTKVLVFINYQILLFHVIDIVVILEI